MTEQQFYLIEQSISSLHRMIEGLYKATEQRNSIAQIVDKTNDRFPAVMKIIKYYETKDGMYIEVTK